MKILSWLRELLPRIFLTEYCFCVFVVTPCPHCGGNISQYQRGNGPMYYRCDVCQARITDEELEEGMK